MPVTPVSASAFTIGGTVSGLTTGQSVSVELNGGGAQTLTGLASGAEVPFTFPSMSSGSTYAVTVSSAPAGLFCPVSAGQGTLSADVSDIAVSCHVPVETVLHSFTDLLDGAQPSAPLIMDSQGNLFGTTASGGANNLGVVFELKSTGPGTWASTTTTLHTFEGLGLDGAAPEAALVMDSQGDLLGTTFQGGSSNEGTVYELSPNGPGSWSASITILRSFTGGSDGKDPLAPLILDGQGDLLGTTFNGGSIPDTGTVFELH